MDGQRTRTHPREITKKTGLILLRISVGLRAVERFGRNFFPISCAFDQQVRFFIMRGAPILFYYGKLHRLDYFWTCGLVVENL
jgi:hypothetical protein